jgi:hypothetical protein
VHPIRLQKENKKTKGSSPESLDIAGFFGFEPRKYFVETIFESVQLAQGLSDPLKAREFCA